MQEWLKKRKAIVNDMRSAFRDLVGDQSISDTDLNRWLDALIVRLLSRNGSVLTDQAKANDLNHFLDGVIFTNFIPAAWQSRRKDIATAIVTTIEDRWGKRRKAPAFEKLGELIYLQLRSESAGSDKL